MEAQEMDLPATWGDSLSSLLLWGPDQEIEILSDSKLCGVCVCV